MTAELGRGLAAIIPFRVKCPCGCAFGAPKKSTGHISRCICSRCVAGKQVPRARQRENRIAKMTGGRRNVGSGNLGGNDIINTVVDIEETTEARIAEGLFKWWFSQAVQQKVAGLRSRNYKPRMFWVNRSQDPTQGLVVMTGADAAHLVDMARRGEERA